MKTSFLLFCLSLFLVLPSLLSAQKEEGRVYEFEDKEAIHIVTLKNGNVFRGRLLNFPYKPKSDTKVTVVFYGEEIEVNFEDLAKVEVTGPDEDAAIILYYPEDRENIFRPENLFISTTAIPMKKGAKEIRLQVPTAAVIATAEFGLGAGFSLSTGTTIPGFLIVLKGKYGAKAAPNFYLGADVTTFAILQFDEGVAGVASGIMTIGSERSFFNLQVGLPFFPGNDGAGVLIFPGFSATVGSNLRLGVEALLFSEDGDFYLPYILPALGWRFKKSNGGIDLGPVLIPDIFENEGLIPIPYGTLYFRF